MTKLSTLIISAVLLYGANPSFAFAKGFEPIDKKTETCVVQCIEIVEFASGWHVVAKNPDGEIAKVISFDIPKDAKRKNSNSNDVSTLQSANGVTTTTTTYETTTEIVVVYITEYRDAKGSLINVQATTVTMPSSDT